MTTKGGDHYSSFWLKIKYLVHSREVGKLGLLKSKQLYLAGLDAMN